MHLFYDLLFTYKPFMIIMFFLRITYTAEIDPSMKPGINPMQARYLRPWRSCQLHVFYHKSKCSREDFLMVFTIYGHGGHLGHVTWIIYVHIGFPFL